MFLYKKVTQTKETRKN